MGSNKRYADSIDRRMDQKIQHLAERPREPAAIVRKLRLGLRNETFYRVVKWVLHSADRTLVGYFTTLDEADRSVPFAPDSPQAPGASRDPNSV